MGGIGRFPSMGDSGGISCMAVPSAVTRERKVPGGERKRGEEERKGRRKALTGGARVQ